MPVSVPLLFVVWGMLLGVVFYVDDWRSSL